MLRTARRLVLGTGAALSIVLAMGVGSAAAAPHFGAASSQSARGWGSAAPSSAARLHFGVSRPGAPQVAETKGEIALTFALAQVGKAYLWGGSGPDAYDCSGLAMAAWRTAGITLTHYTGTQVHQGTPVARSALRPGDLVFFGTASNVYHVGLYVSAEQGGLMVDAPNSNARVRVEQIWWSDYYTAVRPG